MRSVKTKCLQTQKATAGNSVVAFLALCQLVLVKNIIKRNIRDMQGRKNYLAYFLGEIKFLEIRIRFLKWKKLL